MSKIREMVEARRVELLAELRECDEFLGRALHETAAPGQDASRLKDVRAEDLCLPSEPMMTAEQLESLLAAARAQSSPPMARPRAVPDSTVLERALAAPARPGANGIPTVNPNDRLVTDPKTGSVVRIPNGAHQ